ncbi:MAG: desulfoferrodoxin [Lachnospiraceae bacterium]|nr:desulfoferrodoxin [Lachnospiraceae bacterium]
MENRFYICETCGKMVGMIKKTPCPVMCCGKPMKELVPGETDGAVEKHVPVYTREGNVLHVEVGSTLHPMIEAHYIEWIAVQTNQGMQRKPLVPGAEPKADFALLPDEEVVAVYEYCNLHGLFKG